MQFVRQGPDIPERLLQAHEDERVVFFCGAGISYPAQLPGFSGLVKRLYQALSLTPNPVQQSAIKAGQFDTAIGLLEADVVGGRERVRSELATILTPNLTAPNATAGETFGSRSIWTWATIRTTRRPGAAGVEPSAPTEHSVQWWRECAPPAA